MKYGYFVLAGLLMTGCGGGPATGSLQGKVTIKGTPVTGAKLSLRSSAGAGALVDILPDGTLKSGDPIPVGDYKVSLVPNPPEPLPPGTKATKAPPTPIPNKFLNPDTSGWTAQVKSGTTTVNFEIP